MLKAPEKKYVAPSHVSLPERTWPQAALRRAPIWCSQDLRDGNQALVEPMDPSRKRRLYDQLLRIGFRQFEVAFPSASPSERAFVRHLIEDQLIPDDAAIQVLTPAREDLIVSTFTALKGVPRAIVNLYNATAPFFREVVFQKGKGEVIEMAVDAARLIGRLAAEQPETRWTFQYTPEAFSTTELEFSKAIRDAVVEVWQPTEDRRVILNLTATVESTTPNVFADQVEWMHRRLQKRPTIILSVHPHNDRGTAVAAAELALMAGAQRVEGCLFGNGERTGNVDLVTLALNLYSQGISPGLDFSDIDEVRRCVEDCTQLPVHPRHPYAGDLVYTAFSGSHQDAIKKGFATRSTADRWRMPYLPIDPADLGRTYDAVIRVNSQSGKGGVAYLLAKEYGLTLPRGLQIEFARAVQGLADVRGNEISAAEIYGLFRKVYVDVSGPYRYLSHEVSRDARTGQVEVAVKMVTGGVSNRLRGSGATLLEALAQALAPVVLVTPEPQDLGGIGQQVARYVQLRRPGGAVATGVAIEADEDAVAVRAMINALNKATGQESQADVA